MDNFPKIDKCVVRNKCVGGQEKNTMGTHQHDEAQQRMTKVGSRIYIGFVYSSGDYIQYKTQKTICLQVDRLGLIKCMVLLTWKTRFRDDESANPSGTAEGVVQC